MKREAVSYRLKLELQIQKNKTKWSKIKNSLKFMFPIIVEIIKSMK